MKTLPLEEVSINQIFIENAQCTYEVPIYQRNYAWDKEQIEALINDVKDSYEKEKPIYYIGTLVTYLKDDNKYEVIDGQQRLTTIRLILSVLGVQIKNKLVYSARKRSSNTINAIDAIEKIDENKENIDEAIRNGREIAQSSINNINEGEREKFKQYFLNQIHIIHYHVPRDIDLNHYFEVMNSRGEQLEKHEIVKAQLMQKLNDVDKHIFNKIWEACSNMSVYVQQCFDSSTASKIFDNDKFILENFDALQSENANAPIDSLSIKEIITHCYSDDYQNNNKEEKDTFQPIIDFPNFLLIVLKITRMSEPDFVVNDFNLDDKELLNEFGNNKGKIDVGKIKTFAYNLLKAKFFLDNYVVHHTFEEDTDNSNPWELKYLKKSDKGYNPNNLLSDDVQQMRLVHLLSMFEVSFTARQRKNYLFYILRYLIDNQNINKNNYANFVENLAKRYLYNIYLDKSKLNDINTPLPGSFDDIILNDNEVVETRTAGDFEKIYGMCNEITKGIPLFVFNYLDFTIWNIYAEKARSKSDSEVLKFFDKLGCSKFDLESFDKFYFSRTRRSLEHYYPQAMSTGEGGNLSKEQINCLGNFAMIGAQANSSGSNWSPHAKLDHYLDKSNKISRVSVSSLKFLIMMQICKDKNDWTFEQIEAHQAKMLEILFAQ